MINGGSNFIKKLLKIMKDPAVLFYTKDFLTGTAFFTDTERGQYIRLLCEQHQNGHIPENHMVNVCFSLGSPVIKKFIKDSDGNYFNERMEEEILKRNNFIKTRVDNGIKGGRPKEIKKPLVEANEEPLGLPTDNLIGNGNVIENKYKDMFEIFRKTFPGTKRGLNTEFEHFTKKIKDWKIQLPFLLSSIQNQIKIHESKLKAKEFTPEYPMLSTWINQRRWEEEISGTKVVIMENKTPAQRNIFK
jgi:hypothetical protein